MNSNARSRILDRLQSASRSGGGYVPELERSWHAAPVKPSERVELLKQRMELVRTEVRMARQDNWGVLLGELLASRRIQTVAYGAEAWFGDGLRRMVRNDNPLELLPYAADIEEFRDTLFNVEAGITGTRGGIAENGTLILWPDAVEPRLLSLVPPIHIALLRADAIYATLEEAMREMGWGAEMPSNALLISGPSKTADIEMTLAFGVHGPKELIVIVIE